MTTITRWYICGGLYFDNARDAALYYQRAAALRSANARQIRRFGSMRCAQMQREAAHLYALSAEARAAS